MLHVVGQPAGSNDSTGKPELILGELVELLVQALHLLISADYTQILSTISCLRENACGLVKIPTGSLSNENSLSCTTFMIIQGPLHSRNQSNLLR